MDDRPQTNGRQTNNDRQRTIDEHSSLVPGRWSSICIPDEHGHCSTCSDEGMPARVIDVNTELALATVVADEQRLEVGIELLDAVNVGDEVLVHAGFAIARVDQSL